MKLIDELLNALIQTETALGSAELKRLSKTIDLSEPNWEQGVMRESAKFLEKYRETLEKCGDLLVNNFVNLTLEERRLLRRALPRAEVFSHYFLLSEEGDPKVDLRKRLMKLIIIDLGTDTRDILLELRACIAWGEEKGIDCKSIMAELLPLANTKDKHGMGSMKTLLERSLAASPA